MSKFNYLQKLASEQNCVLEKKQRIYTLYSNDWFVEAECKTLLEVHDILKTDPQFQKKITACETQQKSCPDAIRSDVDANNNTD